MSIGGSIDKIGLSVLTVGPDAPVFPSPGNPRIDSLKSSSRLSKLRMFVALHVQSFIDGPLRVNPSDDYFGNGIRKIFYTIITYFCYTVVCLSAI